MTKSSRDIDLHAVAHELTEIALALPHGWSVVLQHDGQVRLLPPATDPLNKEALRFKATSGRADTAW